MSAAHRLLILTGDYSGDMHAAKLVRALRQLQPEIRLAAVGGQHLKAEGVELVSDQSRMGKGVGFGSVLSAPAHYLLGRKILAFTDAFQPDAVLLIDYGVFNLYMARQLKQRGMRVFYFIPPQVWASRRGRLRQIKASVDHVFCIFPFEEALYRTEGIPVTYVGHPLVGQLPPPANRAAFCAEHGLDPGKPIIGLFPGSRKLEIHYLLKPLLGSLPLIRQQQPDAQFVIAKAGSLEDAYFQNCLQQAASPKQPAVSVLENRNHALMSVADCLIAASGTVTLEAALYGAPMVIIYKLHPLVYQIAIRIGYLPCIGLPNILTDPHHPIVRELWQDHVHPAEIAAAALPLLNADSPAVRKARAGYERLRETLNLGDAPHNVARGILSLLGEPVEASETPRVSPVLPVQ